MRSCLFVALVLLAVPPASAWTDAGHMVVAQIALDRLEPDVRKRCEDLLRVGALEGSDSFVTAACWADDIRSGVNAQWHYINEHFRSDGKATTNRPAEQNVVWAIRRFAKVVPDESAAKRSRADALRFLIHFVGDVHQPLHNVARDSDTFPRGDRGGNEFPVVGPPGMKPGPSNLHFLWDIGGGLLPSVRRPLSAAGSDRIRAIADLVTRRVSSNSPMVGIDDPAQWSAECVKIAKEECYSLPIGSVPSEAYLQRCQTTCGDRIALAGYRLARLLNTLLGSR